MNSLARWQMYSGDAVVLPGVDGERRIRLHVNCEHETAFYRTWGEVGAVEQLIAVVPPGVETIEFAAGGDVAWIAVPRDGGQVWYQTADGEPTFVRVVDPVIFTKIANRRHRNPELEEMMYRMQQNMERRLAQQAGEIEAAFERRRLEEANGRPAETVVTDAPGAAANAGGAEVQSPEPVQPEPGADAGGAVDGQSPGGGGA
ncbi:hypothetical protein [Pseudaminobacter sp. NGMCC 1.201702]|uniref:hypothetical protein n=1 Tax=Pseudaminobacter sp. NGMCC 1.201702 TaxID=3391825 RepID=UPI0039F140C9